MADQCVFIRGFRAKRSRLFGIRVIEVGSSRNYGLRNAASSSSLGDSHIGGSSSSLDTIRPPINRENSQLLPYPSSITLQSNGSIYNASFMTSPSFDSLIEVSNDIEEIRHGDTSTEDTTSITMIITLRSLTAARSFGTVCAPLEAKAVYARPSPAETSSKRPPGFGRRDPYHAFRFRQVDDNDLKPRTPDWSA
ncbi:hypothetical protein BGY98DRAFT_1100574 [Russula aff. rugulosa BPL654]|nr:hypothetical protein BGY98DRAFT_1100574 [Russula aff. rugulosa BPL654]